MAITVEPGELTRVANVQIGFSGPIESDTAAEAQRDAIRTDWPLRAGQPFTQQAWDNAKAAALRSLTAKRFPTGSIGTSRAEIDADRSEAKLSLDYQSGPAYRFGPLDVRGSERYDADGARRIARVPTGSDYDQQKLLDAQQRLASSGYYDSVFLTLDTDGTNPLWAPVIAQLREAPLQKVVLGAGFTTDSGPRLSADHIHNRMPLLGWRAVSKLSVDRETKSLGTEWNQIPDDKGWRWFGSGLLKNEVSGSYKVDSGRLRGGLRQDQRPHRLQLLPAVRLRDEPRLQRAAVGLGAERQLGLDRPLLRRRRRTDARPRPGAGARRSATRSPASACPSRASTDAGSASCRSAP